jgi:hypothetical protein
VSGWTLAGIITAAVVLTGWGFAWCLVTVAARADRHPGRRPGSRYHGPHARPGDIPDQPTGEGR